jgi:hypothetical protein
MILRIFLEILLILKSSKKKKIINKAFVNPLKGENYFIEEGNFRK